MLALQNKGKTDMTLFERLQSNKSAVKAIVNRHKGANPRVFGSVARGTATADSDLDLLIDPTDNMTLFDLGAMRREIAMLLGSEVDIATPNALPEHFRDKVLKEAEQL